VPPAHCVPATTSRRAKENTWEHCWQLNLEGIRVTVWFNVATACVAVWTSVLPRRRVQPFNFILEGAPCE
jgi:hypothetical protein